MYIYIYIYIFVDYVPKDRLLDSQLITNVARNARQHFGMRDEVIRRNAKTE